MPYCHFYIFTYIFSDGAEIDQISTNTSRYDTCCAVNVYTFVYICDGGALVPLRHQQNLRKH